MSTISAVAVALGLNPILVRVLMIRSYLPIHAGLGVAWCWWAG
jgi:hypothetical protein